MHKFILLFIRISLFLALLLCFFSENPENSCAAQDVQIYAIHVPQDQVPNVLWQLGEVEAYVAFDKKQFEEITAPERATGRQVAETLLQNAIQSLELEAELKGGIYLEGQGRFLIRNTVFSERKQGETFSIPVQPLGFWLTEPKTSSGEDLSFGSVGNTVFLNFPPTFATPDEKDGVVAVHFHWSLRGQREGREKLIFDVHTPQTSCCEWTLRLPSQWVPFISEGMRSQAQTSQNPSGLQRTWKISPGGRSHTILTIHSSESTVVAPPTLPIRQTLTYDLQPEGLNVKSVVPLANDKIVSAFDSASGKKEPRSTNFIATLDEPLRIRSILWENQQGNQPLTVTAMNEEVEPGSHSYFVSVPVEEGQLIVNAFCPLQTDQRWNLPRIRLQSPQYFWMDTKSHLFVKEPLVIYTLEPNQAIQTLPTDLPTGADVREGSRYSFQYFTPNSRIGVNVTFDSPGLTVKTGTFIQWEEEKITGTMSLDLAPLRQNVQMVELRIQTGWSIDWESLESVPKENLLHWEGDASSLPGITAHSPKEVAPDNSSAINLASEVPLKSLFIFLKKPTRLKLVGARSNSNLSELPLGDLLPVRVYLPEKSREIGKSGPRISSDSGTGKHLIALTANLPNRLKPVETSEQILFAVPSGDPVVREHFFSEIEPATAASIFVLDSNSRTIPVRLEHQKLRFDSEIKCRLTLQDRELAQTCTFKCLSPGTRIDVFYVHWTEHSPATWNWTVGGDRVLSSRILSEADRDRADLSTPPGGIVEEIRLATPRSGTFQLEATRRIPLTQPTAVPLPMLPESTANHVEVIVDSPYSTDVEIVNNGLKSIPVAAPLKNEYQTIRSAFRYDPLRDIGNPEDPLLLLSPHPPSPVSVDERAAKFAMESATLNSSAWVWTLQLDSQFESNGITREHATLFIENRGQKQITMTLPQAIPLENILAVWLENKRITYDPQNESLSEAEPAKISLTLPAKRRFLVVSLEYWHQSQPLVYRSKIRPAFPTVDLPVLGGTWIAWTPPEFQTFLRGRQEGLLVSDKDQNDEFYLFSGLGNSMQSDPVLSSTYFQSFDPFSTAEWAGWFSTGDREKNSSAVAIRLIETLGNESGVRKLLKSETETSTGTLPETGTSAITASSGAATVTSTTVTAEPISWGEVLSHPNFSAKVFSESALQESPQIFIDWIALQRIGVFPTTPIRFFSETSDRIAGHRVLENTGLSLLFFNERGLLITSTLNAAKYQWGLRPLFGDRIKVMRDGPLANRFREAVSGVPFPQWISLDAWNNRTSSQIHPWGNISPSSLIVSSTTGWNALELRRSESENGIYVAHRPTLAALHCFAFLLCVVLFRWKPFSNLIVLSIAAVFFGGLSMILPLYHAVIPLGAFFGTLFALAFTLVRRRTSETVVAAKSPQSPVVLASEDSTDAEYEVRELRPFLKTTSSDATRKEESFFDMLEGEKR